ncbi:MAG: translocation/assembly module TamB domain-containing protein [Bacteroidetes bacterium]|nr:translocation/assembly module TamB domain-containing protein [Bacteroidota bacterium]
MKKFWKILRYPVYVLLFVMLLLVVVAGGGYLFINNTNAGRKWLRGEVTAILNKTLGVPVDIGELELQLPNGIIIRNVVLHDHKGNVLASFNKGSVNHITYNAINDVVGFGDIKLTGLDFKLRSYKGEKLSNLEHIIEFLTPKNPSGKKATEIAFNSVEIENGKFTWDDDNVGFHEGGIDWSHIQVPRFDTRVADVLISSTIRGRVKRLAFSEKSGFKVEDVHTFMSFNNSKMEFENLYIKTPESEIRDYLVFNYNSTKNFVYFVDSVGFNANFINSKASMRDIAFFTNSLQNKTDVINLTAKITGKINDMRGKNIIASFGDKSFIYGNARLKGLPNIDETYIDARIANGRSSRKELMRLFPETQLPEVISKFGVVDLAGNFLGFIHDFVAEGSFRTEIGDVVSDLNLKLGKTPAQSSYSGKLALDNFNLGYLADEKLLGLVTLNGDINGSGLTLDDIKAKLNASINRFDFNGYPYSRLLVDGDFSKKFFKGGLVSHDANFDLNFKGSVDYNKKPEFIGHADVNRVNFQALNFLKDTLILHTNMDFNFRGIKPDEIEGMVQAINTTMKLPSKEYKLDSVLATSTIDTGFRRIHISSNLATADFKGNFKISEVSDLIKTTASRYIDTSFLRLRGKTVHDQYLDFDIRFADLELLFKLLHTKASIKDSGYVQGKISSEKGSISLNGYLPGFTYQDAYFDKIKINAVGLDNTMDVDVTADKMELGDSAYLRDIKLHSTSVRNNFKLTASTRDDIDHKKIKLAGDLLVAGNKGVFSFDKSSLIIGDTTWDITGEPIAIFKGGSQVDFPLITLNNLEQTIKVVGQYSLKEDLPIRIMTDGLQIKTISEFVPELATFDGNINGQILLSNLHKKPIIEAAIFISPLVYNGDTLGNLTATTRYDENTQKLALDGSLQDNQSLDEQLNGNGTISFNNKQAMALVVNLRESPLGILQPVLSGIFSDLKGKATANMKITGTLTEPIFTGTIDVKDGSLKVDYTQAIYHFNHKFGFAGKDLLFENLVMKDINDNSATVNGKLRFKTLTDIRLDLVIKPNYFQLLNTKKEDNGTYYGVANASGLITVRGSITALEMYLKLKSEKGTTFVLPVGNESVSGHDYITFVNPKDTIEKKQSRKLTGIALNCELEITPDARLQIIFDPRTGHMIDGYGHGNLKLYINTAGDFNMYQTLYIDKGLYRFAAFDVINKPFNLKSGSYITWSGNPYEAEMNVQAYSRVRTKISPLFPKSTTSGSSSAELSRVLPVDAKLDLKGALLKPTIKLDFDVLETNTLGFYSSELENQIRKIKSDEQELNKQVVSLIVFKSFSDVNQGFGNDAATSGASAVGGELLLGQFNDIVSRYTENLQVNVDYRPGVGSSVQANLKTFNNTVNIDGSYETNVNRSSTYNVQANYKMNEDGSVSGKVFNRSSNNPVLATNNTNTIGTGITFRKEFNSFRELIPNWLKKKKNRK